MKTKVDLKRVARLQNTNREVAAREKEKKILSRMMREGKMKYETAKRIYNANNIPGLEAAGFMFFYKKYYYTDGGKLQKPYETEVRNLLIGDHRIELHLICSDRVCPMPDPFHLESIKTHKVKDDTEAAALMSKITGITIKKTDL